MSELSSALGGSAPKHHISYNGVSYPVMLVTQGVKVAYEKALFQKVRDGLAQIRETVDKDYYEKKMDKLVDRYEEGEFAMESEYGKKTLGKPGGSLMLLGIILGKKQPDGDIIPMPQLDVMNLIAAKPEEVAAVFRAVIIESFPGVKVADLATTIDLATNLEGTLPKVMTGQGQSSSA